MLRLRTIWMASVLCSGVASAGSADCPPRVEPGFGLPGANWDVASISVHDEASLGGRRVLVGGGFGLVGDVDSSCLAAWDGARWQRLPTPGSTGGVVHVLGNGDPHSTAGAPLIVGRGSLSYIWNGASWNGSLATGCGSITGPYAAVAHPGSSAPAVYSATTCAFGSLPGLARLQGSGWVALTSPLLTGSSVSDLVPFDDGDGEKLYVFGTLNVPGIGAVRAARFDGTSWSPLPEAWPPNITAMRAAREGSERVLYAITFGGTPPAVGVWRLRSDLWTPLTGGASLEGITTHITSYQEDSGWVPYAVSWVLEETPSREVLRWDENGWQSVLRPTLKQPGRSFEMHTLFAADGLESASSALMVGGNFRAFPWGVAHNLAVKRNDGPWRSAHQPAQGILGALWAAESIKEPSSGAELILAAGNFAAAGTFPVQHVAIWDGTSWGGLPGYEFLQAHTVGAWTNAGRKELLLAADVLQQGQPVQDAVLRWDGVQTSPLPGVYFVGPVSIRPGVLDGSPVAFFLGSIAVEQDGESFGTALAWDGTRWHPLFRGSGVPDFLSQPRGLAVGQFPGDASSTIAFVGSPTSAIPEPRPWVAVLREGVWSSFGALTGAFPSVNAVAWFDDGTGAGLQLYAAGQFDSIDGVPAKGAAKRAGTTWVPVGGGFPNGAVAGLGVVPDDAGFSSLVAWGNLRQSDATALGHMARLSAGRWVPAGPNAAPIPSGGSISQLAALPGTERSPSRFVVMGSIIGLGEGVSSGIALFTGLGERPAILSVPTQTIRRATGQPLSISAQVAGPVVSMRWHRAGAPILDNERISGADTPDLTVSGLAIGEPGPYTLVATGPCGSSESIRVNVTVCLDVVIDGRLNTADLIRFLARFGQPTSPAGEGDFDADGDVDAVDLSRLLGAFGRACTTN